MICMNETTKDLNMCDGCYYLRVITLVITKVPSAENLSMSTYVYNFDLLKMLYGGLFWLCVDGSSDMLGCRRGSVCCF